MTKTSTQSKKELRKRLEEELALIREMKEKIEHAGRATQSDLEHIKEAQRWAHKFAKLADNITKEETEAFWVFAWEPVLMSEHWTEQKGKIKRLDYAILPNYHREFNHLDRKNYTKTLPTLGLEEEKGEACIGIAYSFPQKKVKVIAKYMRGALGKDFYVYKVEIILPQNKGTVKALLLINVTHSKVHLNWKTDAKAREKTIRAYQDPTNKHKKTKRPAKQYIKEIHDELIRLGYHDDNVVNMWYDVR